MRRFFLIILVLCLAGCQTGRRDVAVKEPLPPAGEYCPPNHGPVAEKPKARTVSVATSAVPASRVEPGENPPLDGLVEDGAIPEEFRLESDTREAVTDLALAQLDIQYRYGGVSWETGYDCSGFVRWVFAQNGVSLPRVSADQAGAGVHVDRGNLRKGDLVFFRLYGNRISHVGIYLGKGMFIHANRTGGEVRVSALNNPFWQKKYAGARSVL